MASLSDAKELIVGTIVSGLSGSITATKLRTVFLYVVGAIEDTFGTKADLASPAFTGTPTAPTAAPATDDDQIASTAFVHDVVAAATVGVSSFNGRTGAVTQTSGDVTTALGFAPAPAASPTLTGTPLSPTAANGTNTTQIASTGFVQNAIGLLKSTVSVSFDTLAKIETAILARATLASPVFSGTPTVPTAAPGTNTLQAASTAFVAAAVSGAVAGVSSFNGRTGAVTPNSGDVTGALGFTPANINSPAFTGTPTAPLAADGDTTSKIASTTFVQNAIVLIKGGVSATYDTLQKLAAALATKADLASPTFTGTPAAPTAAPGTNTGQIATTAFVQNAVSGKISSIVLVNNADVAGQGISGASVSLVGGVATITFTKQAFGGSGGGGGA